jgi:hypothetical protein
MSQFHGSLLAQLPKSWLPILAQGARVIVTKEGLSLDWPDEIVITIPWTGGIPEAFLTLDNDACGSDRKSFRPNQREEHVDPCRHQGLV